MSLWYTITAITVPTLAFGIAFVLRPAQRSTIVKQWCVVIAIVLGVPAFYRIIEQLIRGH